MHQLFFTFSILYLIPLCNCNIIKHDLCVICLTDFVCFVNLQKNVPAVLKTVRSPPDVLEEYKEEYRKYLGPALQAAVIKHRQIPTVNPTHAASSNPFKPSAVSFAPVSR